MLSAKDPAAFYFVCPRVPSPSRTSRKGKASQSRGQGQEVYPCRFSSSAGQPSQTRRYFGRATSGGGLQAGPASGFSRCRAPHRSTDGGGCTAAGASASSPEELLSTKSFLCHWQSQRLTELLGPPPPVRAFVEQPPEEGPRRKPCLALPQKS